MNLPPRMEARPGKKWTSYRYIPRHGKKHNLGRDLDTALKRYAVLTQAKPAFDPLSDRAILELWARHRKGAKQRGLEFGVTLDEVRALMRHQDGRCAVTRLAFKDEKPKGMRIRPWMPSLDRIKPTLGYSAPNLRIVCGFVNIALNGFGDSFFEVVLQPLIQAAIEAERLRAEMSNSHLGILMGSETTKPGQKPG